MNKTHENALSKSWQDNRPNKTVLGECLKNAKKISDRDLIANVKGNSHGMPKKFLFVLDRMTKFYVAFYTEKSIKTQ